MKKTPVGLVVFLPDWIDPNSAKVRAFIQEGIDKLGVPAISSATVSTPADLRALMHSWAVKLAVQPGRIQFREMYRKWGSCSSKGNITLNSALLNVPRPLAEYVIVHELVHLRVFNHGKDFKALMRQHLPDYLARETELDKLLKGGNDHDLDA